jgi:anaerobic selenocysteine-containing dehydrogenase
MSDTAHKHYRTCHLCEAMCGVVIEHEGGQILSIKGDKDDPFSRGHICPKAVALKDLHEDPDRLRKPVKRVGTEWVEISWDEAFATVERELLRIRRSQGNDAVGIYLGNPTVHTPATLLIPDFVKALGARQVFSATSVDQLPTMLANLQLFGHQLLFPVPDLDRTDFFLIVGGNPAASNGSLMSAGDPMGRIKAIRERGGKVVVVDPRRTETADKADEHIFIRPGTDFFLLAAMAQVLFADGLVRLGHLAAHVDGLADLQALVAPFTPEAVSGHTGIPASKIRALARDFAAAESAACYGRVGACVQQFGGLTTWLLHVMNIITGNLDHEGGMMFANPPLNLVGLGSKGSFGKYRTRVRGLPAFSGEFPVSAMAEEILTPGPKQIRALVTHAGNPVLSTPNGRQLDEALASLEFMVSIDIYINETTRHAHIILPPTSALERSHMEVGLTPLMVRNAAKWSPALFEAPKDARHDWQLLLELTGRLREGSAAQRVFRKGLYATVAALGFDRTLDMLLRSGPYGRLAPLLDKKQSPLQKIRRIVSSPANRINLKALKAAPHGIDLGALQSGFPQRLATRGRRINLVPDIYRKDVARAEEALGEALVPEFLVIGRRHVRSNNSWMHNSHRLIKGKSRCTVMMHPDDAERLGLSDGATVEVRSRVGSIRLATEITDQVMPGVISIPHGFGHGRQGVRLGTATRKEVAGASLNDITDEMFLDALTGMPVLNGVPVQVLAVQTVGDGMQAASALV